MDSKLYFNVYYKLWSLVNCKCWLPGAPVAKNHMYLGYVNVSMWEYNSTILDTQNQLIIDSIEKTVYKTSKKWVESLVLMLNVNTMTFQKPLCWDHIKERSVPTTQDHPTVLMPDEENSLIELSIPPLLVHFLSNNSS